MDKVFNFSGGLLAVCGWSITAVLIGMLAMVAVQVLAAVLYVAIVAAVVAFVGFIIYGAVTNDDEEEQE